MLLLVSAALAKSPCVELKPTHKPSNVDLGAATSAVSTAMTVAGVPGGAAVGMLPKRVTINGSQPTSSGATNWALYQVCLLKEAGVFTPDQAAQVAQAVLVGDAPAATPAAPPAPAIDQYTLDARAQMKRNIQYICGIQGGEQACEIAKEQLAQFDQANHISMP